MKCPSEVELNEYAEDRLPSARRWEVSAHLRDCAGCRTDLEGLDWASVALDELLAEETPEAAHPSLEDLAALKDGRLPALRRAEVLTHLGTCPECAQIYGGLPREQRALPLVRSWQPLAAAASLLLIVGFIFFVVRGEFAPGRGVTAPPAMHVERSAPPTAEGPAAPSEGGSAAPVLPGDSVAPKAAAATPAPADGGHPTTAPPTRRLAGATAPPTPRLRRDHLAVRPVAPPSPPRAAVAMDEGVAPAEPLALMAAGAPTVAPTPRMSVAMAEPLATHGGQPETSAPRPGTGGFRAAAAGGGGVPKMAADATRGAAPNTLRAWDGLSQNAKLEVAAAPAASIPAMAPGMPGVAAPAARAPGGVTAMAAPPAPIAPSPPPTLTNRVLLDREWLAQVRSDPQRKARVKATLRQMLKQEKSGQQRNIISGALRALDQPVRTARRAGKAPAPRAASRACRG